MKEYKDALAMKDQELATMQISLAKFLEESELMGNEIKKLSNENDLLRSQVKALESKVERLLREHDDIEINENKLRDEIGSLAEELLAAQLKILDLEAQISGFETSRV